MGLLIDGNNVLGQRRGRNPREPDARADLVRRIAAHCRATRASALVVFDGEPDAAAPGPVRALGPVQVRFSGPGREADDLILEIVGRSADPAGTTVVTSDRSLADRAKWAGARTMRSDKFRGLLAEIPRGLAEGGVEARGPTKAEVDYWMKIFGGASDPPEE